MIELIDNDTLYIDSVGEIEYEQIEQYKEQTKKMVFNGGVTIPFGFIYNLGWEVEEIDFGEGSVFIGDQSFRHCTSLSKVTIGPYTQYDISNNPFSEATSSLQFVIDNANEDFWMSEECLYYQDSIVCIPLRIESVTVPANVTQLCGLCGYKSPVLSSVTLLATPTWCGHATFQESPSLLTIAGAAMDGKLLVAGKYVSWCSTDMAGDIVLPDGPTTCLYGTFRKCALITSVRFPRSYYLICGQLLHGCTSLKTIIFEGPTDFISDFFVGSSVELIRFKSTNVTRFATAAKLAPQSFKTIQIPCGASAVAFDGIQVSIEQICTPRFSKNLITRLPNIFVHLILS